MLPGFEYDIFISYRHNDNRSGWVTEFVKALQEELAAALKDPVSVYFDTNPHDGLLETHDVDKSLETKLRCLLFIPVLSQTYCDPKSFAWRNEFCAFNKLAGQDSYGKTITLSNGNVASRILPVKIHILDPEDTATFEREISGRLRAIEFIYKEAGVNRPLKPSDNRAHNQNNTDYQNQINKLANAIKEIVLSIKRQANKASTVSSPSPSQIDNQKNRYRPLAYIGIALLLVAFAGYQVYQSVTRSGSPKEIDASIAVLPFVDLTPSGDMEYLGDGIADEIINSLTTIRGLKVSGRTSSFQFKGEKYDLRTIGDRLKVGYVLEGSVQKYENNFRITAQLIRTEDNFHAWSERFDLREVNIFKIQDSIAAAVVEKLRITLTPFEKTQITKKETSQKAYAEFLKGVHQFKNEHYPEAEAYTKKSIQLDSTYAPAYALMGLVKGRILYNGREKPNPDSVKVALWYARRATELDPALPEGYSALGLVTWMTQRDFVNARIYFDKSLDMNPTSSLIRNRYAYFLTWMGDFVKASQMNRYAIAQDPIDYNSYVLLFDSAFYNMDPVAGAKILSQYQQLFGMDSRWTNFVMQLDYIKGDFRALSRRADSIVSAGGRLDPVTKSLLARSYIKSGKYTQANRIKSQLIQGASDPNQQTCLPLGLIYAVENKPDSCFHFLKIAVERFEFNVITLKIEPDLIRYHQDPRYETLYRSMGFEKYDQWIQDK